MTHNQQQWSLTDLIVAVSCKLPGALANGASECQQQNSHDGARRCPASFHCAALPNSRLLGQLLSCARTQHRAPILAEWRRARPVRYSLSIRDFTVSSEYSHISFRHIGFLTKQGEWAGEFLDIWTREGQIKHRAMAGAWRTWEDCEIWRNEWPFDLAWNSMATLRLLQDTVNAVGWGWSRMGCWGCISPSKTQQ
jgi:hypothetical protein